MHYIQNRREIGRQLVTKGQTPPGQTFYRKKRKWIRGRRVIEKGLALKNGVPCTMALYVNNIQRLPSPNSAPAGLAQLGERQTEVHFITISEGHVFDPHKPHTLFFFFPFFPFNFLPVSFSVCWLSCPSCLVRFVTCSVCTVSLFWGLGIGWWRSMGMMDWMGFVGLRKCRRIVVMVSER